MEGHTSFFSHFLPWTTCFEIKVQCNYWLANGASFSRSLFSLSLSHTFSLSSSSVFHYTCSLLVRVYVIVLVCLNPQHL
jgi:hypothetical protein